MRIEDEEGMNENYAWGKGNRLQDATDVESNLYLPRCLAKTYKRAKTNQRVRIVIPDLVSHTVRGHPPPNDIKVPTIPVSSNSFRYLIMYLNQI